MTFQKRKKSETLITAMRREKDVKLTITPSAIAQETLLQQSELLF